MTAQDVERLTRERDLYRQLAYDYAWAIWCTEMDCDPESCGAVRCLPGLQCRDCVETMVRGHCMVDSDARNEMMPVGYYQRIEATLQALRELHYPPAPTKAATMPEGAAFEASLAALSDVWFINEPDEVSVWDMPGDVDDEA